MSPMSDGVSRRDFLFYGAAGATGVTLGQYGRWLLAPEAHPASGLRGTGRERWATTPCRECPAGCGMRVRLVDDVPVKLEGNPLCPIGRGRLCAKGQAALEAYFDPDRLVGPARRTGTREDPRWEPIAWEAALALLASQLSKTATGTEQPLVVSAEEHGPAASARAGFWAAAGARVVSRRWPTAARLRSQLAALTGVDREPLFDLENASHVVSFGAPVAEDWLSGVWAQRSYGRFRRGASRPRGRLVQVDPRLSNTARKADEWLALPVEQHLALAYGIASVLLRENRVNRAALDPFVGNLAELERAVVMAFSPDQVAARTGIPVVTLLRIARELAQAARPLAVVAADASPSLIEAVLCLDALLGAYDRAGGIFASPSAPAPDLDDAASALRDVASGVLRPRLVVLGDASALRSLDSPADLGEALGHADLVVSFSPYLDESSAVADLLMPVHTPLEAWHGFVPPAAVAAEAVVLGRPVVEPRLETRDSLGVLRALAEALGGAALEACPWKSSEAVIDAELTRLMGLRRGTPYKGVFETNWVRDLERGGWWVSETASAAEFGNMLLEAGGWVDPYFEAGAIHVSLRQRNGFSFPGSLEQVPLAAPPRGEEGGTPSARGSRPGVPLRLLPFVPPTLNLAGGPNQPILYELLGQPDGAPWRVWAELSPESAEAIGVRHGAEVRIASADSGASITAIALVVEGMVPESVAVAFVPANPGGGRWARLVDADVRRVLGPREPAGAGRVIVTPL